MPTWCDPEKGQRHPSGELIGEIFFSPHSVALALGDTNALDKLVNVLGTHHGTTFEPASLLLLGDVDGLEAPQAKADLAKNRANAVANYLTTKIPSEAQRSVKIEPAGKGAGLLPGQKMPAGAVRRRVVEIINRGKPIRRMAAPLKKAASVKEAFDTAAIAAKGFPPDKAAQARRIRHWLEGPARPRTERGDDAYLRGENPTVFKQAEGLNKPRLSDGEWKTLLDQNRIGRELMTVAAPGNPEDLIRNTLLTIDAGIDGGIELLGKAST